MQKAECRNIQVKRKNKFLSAPLYNQTLYIECSNFLLRSTCLALNIQETFAKNKENPRTMLEITAK